MAFSPNAETVYADGPFGSPLQPAKSEIRSLLAQYEAAIDAYSSGAGSIAKSTRALLFADLAHAADVTAWVYADSTVAHNGIYRKSGASGAGSWSLILPLPFSFIIASDAGAGTPNAIQATTSIPVSSSALVWMNIFEANTASPVTVSFNGGSALTIKTNSGNDVAAGGLTAGMIVMGIVSGSTFRLVSDQASAAVLAAAEAAQAAAEAAQAAAEAAVSSVNLPIITVADAGKALAVNPAGDGYEVKPTGELTAVANHTNAASREIRARYGDIPVLLDWSGGDDQDRLLNALAANPGSLIIPAVDLATPYEIEDTVILPPGTVLVGQGMRDVWDGNADKASFFRAVGAATARRWTDIDGTDAADDTPMFVAGGNGVRFKGIALETNSDTPWSMGLFFPCVKRCGYDDDVSVDGPWTDAAVYLDMTWSDRNTTLKALHPTVQTSTGMTEFRGGDAYLRGVRSLRIQGTTRDPSAADPNTWEWGWGGISDTIFNGGQYRPLGASASRACIWLDAALPGSTALAASGVTFNRPALRSGVSQYMAYFDRFSRVEFFGGYGEAPSGELAQWRLHSTRTTEISVWGGRYVRAPIYVDGVDSGQTMENGQGNHPSFYNRTWSGKGFFPGRVEDGGTIRPSAASTGALGNTSFPFASANVDQIRLGDNTKPRLMTAVGNPEGVVSAPVGSVCLSSNGTQYRKTGGGSGSTGWVVMVV